jgi:hypothetical protein
MPEKQKPLTFALQVPPELHARVLQVVDIIKDPYGKHNRSFVLRRLLELGLEQVERDGVGRG